MESVAPILPVLAIVMVAVLTFLYTVATAVESKTELIQLKIDAHQLRDNYAKRRAEIESGEAMSTLDVNEVIDCEATVIDPGLGGGDGSASKAA